MGVTYPSSGWSKWNITEMMVLLHVWSISSVNTWRSKAWSPAKGSYLMTAEWILSSLWPVWKRNRENKPVFTEMQTGMSTRTLYQDGPESRKSPYQCPTTTVLYSWRLDKRKLFISVSSTIKEKLDSWCFLSIVSVIWTNLYMFVFVSVCCKRSCGLFSLLSLVHRGVHCRDCRLTDLHPYHQQQLSQWPRLQGWWRCEAGEGGKSCAEIRAVNINSSRRTNFRKRVKWRGDNTERFVNQISEVKLWSWIFSDQFCSLVVWVTLNTFKFRENFVVCDMWGWEYNDMGIFEVASSLN